MVKTSEEPLGPSTTGKLNHRVRRYWDREPCGTGPAITQQIRPRSSRWFEQVDSHRYSIEPHIPAFAEFGRFKGGPRSRDRRRRRSGSFAVGQSRGGMSRRTRCSN
jgi:hypothetical protein